MKLIFLDIDGVLNNHSHCDEAKSSRIEADRVRLLNMLLKATGAKVVLSSAWRYLVHRGDMQVSGIDWLLRSHGMLADRLIGITQPDTMTRDAYNGDPKSWPVVNERGQQIVDWMDAWFNQGGEDIEGFVAIDDLDLGITRAGVPLVLTEGSVGLTPVDIRKAAHVLHAEIAQL